MHMLVMIPKYKILVNSKQRQARVTLIYAYMCPVTAAQHELDATMSNAQLDRKSVV